MTCYGQTTGKAEEVTIGAGWSQRWGLFSLPLPMFLAKHCLPGAILRQSSSWTGVPEPGQGEEDNNGALHPLHSPRARGLPTRGETISVKGRTGVVVL